MGSKRRRNKGGGRGARRDWRLAGEPDEPGLRPYIHAALASHSPFGLLQMVSTLMYCSDPRRRPLFGGSGGPEFSRDDIVARYIEDSSPEASAVLAVFAEFLADDHLLAKPIRTELANRPPLRPKWLTRLGQTQIHRAVRVSHVLDGSDSLLLEGRVPAAHGDFTCAVSLDLDRGDTIREVCVVSAPIEQVVATIEVPTTDIRTEEIALADVRARLLRAIEFEFIGRPVEGASWPQYGGLVEWLIRRMPEGGSADPRSEWSYGDVAALTGRFSASPQGAMFGRRHEDMLESLVEFGIDSGAGDPTRWDERRAKRWLFDHLLGDYRYEWLSGREIAPFLLRSFIRFVHDEVGIRPELTDEVLAAIETWESEYQEKLRHELNEEDVEYFDAASGDG